LILFSAAIGVVPAFLLRGVLQAIPRNDTTRLSLYAGGMIAIAIATGVLGVPGRRSSPTRSDSA